MDRDFRKDLIAELSIKLCLPAFKAQNYGNAFLYGQTLGYVSKI
jgi:hypothetical protein